MRYLTLLLFPLCLLGQITETNISDTVRSPIGGRLVDGYVEFQASHNLICGSYEYGRNRGTKKIVAGVLTASLVPNTACHPLDVNGNAASYYLAKFVDVGGGGTTWTSALFVPVSSYTLPLAAVMADVPLAATASVTPLQLTSGGASSGQYLQWDGSKWAPVTLTGVTPAAHASTHAAAGSDPVTVAESQVTGLTTALSGKEPTIAAGTTAQYWRGDKSWQTLNKSAVGLGNVENTALSTWTGSANITALGTLVSGALPWTLVTGAPSTYAPSGHAANHQHSGSDEIATATPAANAIPKAGAGGTLGAGWIPALSYAPPTSGTDILKGNGSGGFSAAAAGTDYIAPYTSQTANYFLAAPNGSAGVPSFRAIVAADVPTLNQNTTGTAAGLSTTLGLASGGTNQTSWTASRCVQVAADGTKLESASAACGSGSASSPYAITFTSSTTQTVTAATHGLGTDPLDGGCYTVTTGAKIIPSSWAKNSSGDVTITVDPAWTGTCYLHAGAGYTGGGAVSSVFGRTGAVTSATNDYAMSQISGTAAISQGGTGATTAAAARVALLPSMTGNALKRVRVNTGATDIEYVTSSYDLEGSATLSSWGTIGAGACVEKNLTVTGAVSGDRTSPGWPSTLEAGIMGMMVPGTDLVVVRLCNVTGSGVAVADGKTFSVGINR